MEDRKTYYYLITILERLESSRGELPYKEELLKELNQFAKEFKDVGDNLNLVDHFKLEIIDVSPETELKHMSKNAAKYMANPTFPGFVLIKMYIPSEISENGVLNISKAIIPFYNGISLKTPKQFEEFSFYWLLNKILHLPPYTKLPYVNYDGVITQKIRDFKDCLNPLNEDQIKKIKLKAKLKQN